MARRRGQTEAEALLALPHTGLIDGKPYLRLAFIDERAGRYRSKTRRVHGVDDYAQTLEYLKRKIGAQPSDYDPEKITFNQLIMEFKKAKPDLREWYLKPLEEHFGKQKLKTITYGDLAEFKEKREAVPHRVTGEPRKASTINREMEALREVRLYAVRHE
jgi:hypothetical protein